MKKIVKLGSCLGSYANHKKPLIIFNINHLVNPNECFSVTSINITNEVCTVISSYKKKKMFLLKQCQKVLYKCCIFIKSSIIWTKSSTFCFYLWSEAPLQLLHKDYFNYLNKILKTIREKKIVSSGTYSVIKNVPI